jgi:hypothetical protein
MPLLAEANRLLAAGQPAEAARLFADLAEKAQANGNLQRAAHLHLQAARGLLAINDLQPALSHARAAMQLFTQAGQFGRADAIYQRLVSELRARGMAAEAETLERDLRSQFGEAATTPSPASGPAPARGRLPAQCPQCGGPVRGDEVEWIDDHSAECVYCGSVVQTE